MAKFKLTSFSKKLPKRFKAINCFILLPILLWPLIFFGSIFIFDNPKNMNQAYGLFFLINSYPIFLLILFEANARIYKRLKNVGYIIPVTIIGFLAYGFITEYLQKDRFVKERNIKEQERKEAGFIGDCDTYKIEDNTVYYKDTIINADPNTFEYLRCHYGKDKDYAFRGGVKIHNSDSESFVIIDWLWQKDKSQYYYRGIAINQIDYESFEILELTYSKDKSNVYYGTEIVEEANPNTFKINRMNGIGTDNLNSFKNGRKITE